MRENNQPVWNGEFGPVYDSEGAEKNAIINERKQMLEDLISLKGQEHRRLEYLDLQQYRISKHSPIYAANGED